MLLRSLPLSCRSMVQLAKKILSRELKMSSTYWSFAARYSCDTNGSVFGTVIFSGWWFSGLPKMKTCRTFCDLDGILSLPPFSNSHAHHAGRVGYGKNMRKASDSNMLRELVYLDEGCESPIGPFEIVKGPVERGV